MCFLAVNSSFPKWSKPAKKIPLLRQKSQAYHPQMASKNQASVDGGNVHTLYKSDELIENTSAHDETVVFEDGEESEDDKENGPKDTANLSMSISPRPLTKLDEARFLWKSGQLDELRDKIRSQRKNNTSSVNVKCPKKSNASANPKQHLKRNAHSSIQQKSSKNTNSQSHISEASSSNKSYEVKNISSMNSESKTPFHPSQSFSIENPLNYNNGTSSSSSLSVYDIEKKPWVLYSEKKKKQQQQQKTLHRTPKKDTRNEGRVVRNLSESLSHQHCIDSEFEVDPNSLQQILNSNMRSPPRMSKNSPRTHSSHLEKNNSTRSSLYNNNNSNNNNHPVRASQQSGYKPMGDSSLVSSMTYEQLRRHTLFTPKKLKQMKDKNVNISSLKSNLFGVSSNSQGKGSKSSFNLDVCPDSSSNSQDKRLSMMSQSSSRQRPSSSHPSSTRSYGNEKRQSNTNDDDNSFQMKSTQTKVPINEPRPVSTPETTPCLDQNIQSNHPFSLCIPKETLSSYCTLNLEQQNVGTLKTKSCFIPVVMRDDGQTVSIHLDPKDIVQHYLTHFLQCNTDNINRVHSDNGHSLDDRTATGTHASGKNPITSSLRCYNAKEIEEYDAAHPTHFIQGTNHKDHFSCSNTNTNSNGSHGNNGSAGGVIFNHYYRIGKNQVSSMDQSYDQGTSKYE